MRVREDFIVSQCGEGVFVEGIDSEGLSRGTRMVLLRMHSASGGILGHEQTSVARCNVDETCRYIIRFGCALEACFGRIARRGDVGRSSTARSSSTSGANAKNTSLLNYSPCLENDFHQCQFLG